jgi:hypothetical protein
MAITAPTFTKVASVTVLHEDLQIKFHPKLVQNMESTGTNSFMPVSKL